MTSLVYDAQMISKFYPQGDSTIEVIKNCNFQVKHGEHIAIVGRSGSGKSTLLNLLSGVEQTTGGCLDFNGEQLTGPHPHIAITFQQSRLLAEFTALENVTIPLYLRGHTHYSANARAKELLEALGLAERMYHFPNMLSGGECARVSIARALSYEPSVLLADEPTGNLDGKTKDEVIEVMLNMVNHHKAALIFVTHDHSLLRHFNHIYELRDGSIHAT